MAGVRFSILRSLHSSVNPCRKVQSCRSYNYDLKLVKYDNLIHVRPLHAFVNRNYHTKESQSPETLPNNHFRAVGSQSFVHTQHYKIRPSTLFLPILSNLRFHSTSPLTLIRPLTNYRSYSSSVGSKADRAGDTGVPDGSGASGVVVSDFVDKAKDSWQSIVDAATYTGQKAKEASDELTPYVHQLLDSHPYLKNVIIPVGSTLAGTILAWLVMPRLLRRFHKYTMQGSSALPIGSLAGEQVPYEKSVWGALEDPVRYLITFMAFSQICVMVAPTTVASQYLAQAWRGAIILSFIWFLHRWKTNVFTRVLAAQILAVPDRERLLALDKLSSIGLFVIGIMALAEACGVAVQSILTVGGIGGVATAFAARDILGNVLSGLSMQFSKPFSLGDTIKAGNIEGQVVEMGLTTTSLLNAEKFPVIVPNSLFSSQIIVNKSRAQFRAMVTKIPVRADDLDKIPHISNDVKSMLRSNSKVFLEKERPYCFLSRIESYYAELTIGCNLKHMENDRRKLGLCIAIYKALQITIYNYERMNKHDLWDKIDGEDCRREYGTVIPVTSKDELYATEQDILLQAVQIIKKHGARLGSSSQEMTSGYDK